MPMLEPPKTGVSPKTDLTPAKNSCGLCLPLQKMRAKSAFVMPACSSALVDASIAAAIEFVRLLCEMPILVAMGKRSLFIKKSY